MILHYIYTLQPKHWNHWQLTVIILMQSNVILGNLGHWHTTQTSQKHKKELKVLTWPPDSPGSNQTWSPIGCAATSLIHPHPQTYRTQRIHNKDLGARHQKTPPEVFRPWLDRSELFLLHMGNLHITKQVVLMLGLISVYCFKSQKIAFCDNITCVYESKFVWVCVWSPRSPICQSQGTLSSSLCSMMALQQKWLELFSQSLHSEVLGAPGWHMPPTFCQVRLNISIGHTSTLDVQQAWFKKCTPAWCIDSCLWANISP